MEDEQIIQEGYIHSLIFQNEENGYTVLRLVNSDGEVYTVVGCIPCAVPGEQLLIRGVAEVHPQHGDQLRALEVERSLPEDEDAIISYLSSSACRGVGPATARRIVERFGQETLQILERDPAQLTSVQGITRNRARSIGESFKQQMGLRRLMDFLARNHLPVILAVELRKQYGDDALAQVERNPYLLSRDVYGVPFVDVDRIAIEMGFAVDCDDRLRAAVLFELRHNEASGHVFLPRRKLEAATAEYLHCPLELAEKTVDDLEALGEVVQEHIAREDACYTRRLWDAETTVCSRICGLLSIQADQSNQALRAVDEIEREQNITYAPQQRQAVELAAQSGVLLITGGPGTGKTTSVRGIVALFKKMGLDILLAAPTGRAAQRLGELTGMEAQTIHRLLGMGRSENRQITFAKTEKDPLQADAVIVDEMSMVDLPLFAALLRALRPGTRLVLVGDADQLPSVGAGVVFSDLIRSRKIATVFLREIFRQAEQSAIIRNAHAVNAGELPRLVNDQKDFFFLRRRDPERAVSTVVELCKTRLPTNMGIPSDQVQVLTPTRKGPTGTIRLNQLLQEALNPPRPDRPEITWNGQIFRQGDRVMQTRNDYDILWERPDGCAGSGMFNGDVGQIVELDPSGEYLAVQFDDRRAVYGVEQLSELDLAYAQTVHKAQGSEYRCVILCAMPGPRTLMVRSVLYTALTRARELLIVVGDDAAIRTMTANDRQQRRYSGLKWRLTHESLPPPVSAEP